MLTLSIAALRAADACDLEVRIADLRAVRPDVTEEEGVPLVVWWALPTTSVADRWWSLRVASPAPEARRLAVRGAAMAARRVLHLAYPEHRAACEAAIVAAEEWAAASTEAREVAAAGAARAVGVAWGAWAAAGAARAAEAAGAAEAAEAAAWAAGAARAAENAARAAEIAADDAAWADELDSQREDLDRLLRELE